VEVKKVAKKNYTKRMKRKYIAYAALSVLGLSLAGVGVASAHGMGGFGGGFFGGNTLTPDEIASRQQAQFQNMATLLGISVDDVKTAWAQGKNIQQVAQDHGITTAQLQQKMKDARAAQLKSELDTLVQKGIITQAQADQRLQFIQNQAGKMKGHMGHGGFF